MNARVASRAVLATLWLAGCSSRHSRGDDERADGRADAAAQDASASAEPPTIAAERLLLVIEGDRVHMIGERGAVLPGGIEVEVQWPVTGEITTGDVAEDGSFDVVVAAWIEERYRVQAVRRDPPARSEAVFVSRGAGERDAGISADDGGTLSCAALGEAIHRSLGSGEIGGHCQRDSDCTVIAAPKECGLGCSATAAPHSARPLVEARYAAVRDSLCADYHRAGCPLLTPPPGIGTCAQDHSAECIDGLCTNCANDWCDSEVCERCPFPEIEWGAIGGEAAQRHRLGDCRFFVTDTERVTQCMSELQCVSHSSRRAGHNASRLLRQLEDTVVQSALARGAFFGARGPDAFGVELFVGAGSLTVSALRCNGASGCEDPPEPVIYLRDQLNGIVIQETARCR